MRQRSVDKISAALTNNHPTRLEGQLVNIFPWSTSGDDQFNFTSTTIFESLKRLNADLVNLAAVRLIVSRTSSHGRQGEIPTDLCRGPGQSKHGTVSHCRQRTNSQNTEHSSTASRRYFSGAYFWREGQAGRRLCPAGTLLLPHDRVRIPPSSQDLPGPARTDAASDHVTFNTQTTQDKFPVGDSVTVSIPAVLTPGVATVEKHWGRGGVRGFEPRLALLATPWDH